MPETQLGKFILSIMAFSAFAVLTQVIFTTNRVVVQTLKEKHCMNHINDRHIKTDKLGTIAAIVI